MTAFSAPKLILLTHQKQLTGLLWPLQSSQLLRLTSYSVLSAEDPECVPQRKLLKVAFLGRPNVGKSTLINKILNLTLCGASHKSHTTRTPLRAAFTTGDTQLVFLDTPGLVTQKEISRGHQNELKKNWSEKGRWGFLGFRPDLCCFPQNQLRHGHEDSLTGFKLPKNFNQAWNRNFIDDVDVVGVVHEINETRDIFKYPIALMQNVQEIPKTKPLFLVINKIDLVLDKKALQTAIDYVTKSINSKHLAIRKKPEIWEICCKIFFTSVVKNIGVSEITKYLLEQAKPGNWLFEVDQLSDKPLEELVVELLRAEVLNLYPQEVPYLCKYEIEYLKENDLGEIICVALITCRYKKHAILIKQRKSYLRLLCKKLESNLYKILGRIFKIRIVVQEPNQ